MSDSNETARIAESSGADSRADRRSRFDALNAAVVDCARCPRLREYGREVAQTRRRAFADQEYWGRPVPNFGDPSGRLLIVGLAPAAHGAHRTGRMFTGDRSGDFLYAALHRAGFANQSTATHADDGLELHDAAITATCHCAPPANQPTPAEVDNCRPWLQQILTLMPVRVLLALGDLGYRAALTEVSALGWFAGRRPKFAHGLQVELTDHRLLLAAYHPSQQNTFTGRVTPAMYDNILQTIKSRLDHAG